MSEEDVLYICHECIGDSYLSSLVSHEGQPQLCSYCEETKISMSLESVAELFHNVIETQFERTADQPDCYEFSKMDAFGWDWVRDGQPVEELIQEVGDIKEEIAKKGSANES